MGTAPAPAQAPRRRGGRPPDRFREPLELDTYSTGPLHRSVPVSDEVDIAKARWIELLLHEPQGARRAALEAKRAYWQSRVEALETRFRIARQAVIDALKSTEGADGRPLPPAAAIHELRIRRTVAWADVQAAKVRLAEIERALADA